MKWSIACLALVALVAVTPMPAAAADWPSPEELPGPLYPQWTRQYSALLVTHDREIAQQADSVERLPNPRTQERVL